MMTLEIAREMVKLAEGLVIITKDHVSYKVMLPLLAEIGGYFTQGWVIVQ